MIHFFLISLLLFGCSNYEDGLEEVKGIDVTYSQQFKSFDRLDDRENIKFYKPIAIEQIKSYFPEQIQKAVNMINSEVLPFEVDEKKAYLVTFEDVAGEVKHQIQLSYLGKSEYDIVDNFFIISVTEVEENPIEEFNFSEESDLVGNEFKKEVLIDDIPLFKQVITTDSALLYQYYEYDETKEKVGIVGTSANEFYSYYNGFVYHIGYFNDRQKNTTEVQEEMLNLTRNFILGSDL